MNKNTFTVLLCFLTITIAIKAQPAMDTMKYSLKQKPQIYFSFDSRNSFIDNRRAKIFGFLAGVNYNNRLYFALGYNQLYPPTTNFDEYYYYVNKENKKDSVTEKLKLFYISASAEFVFYTSKHWSLSMPLQIGFGDAYYKYNLNGENIKLDESFNFVYEPAVAVQYKFCKYFGVGADIGYRFMVTPERKLNQKFTSPIYAFSTIIYYYEVYKYFFKKKGKSS